METKKQQTERTKEEEAKEQVRRISAGIWLFIGFFCFLGTVETETLAVIIIATLNMVASWLYARKHLRMFQS